MKNQHAQETKSSNDELLNKINFLFLNKNSMGNGRHPSCKKLCY